MHISASVYFLTVLCVLINQVLLVPEYNHQNTLRLVHVQSAFESIYGFFTSIKQTTEVYQFANVQCVTSLAVKKVFRHGDKTTDHTYPKDPYLNENYYPHGIGELTNKGKHKMYLLGKALRERYNNFLGSTYTPEVLDAFSTQLNRAKMSLQLVVAGLYPPKGTVLEWEKDLNWQPIPYNSLIFSTDHLMSPSLYFCAAYIKHYQAYLNSPAGLKLQQKYAQLFPYVSDNTGWSINSIFNISRVYDLLKTEEEYGFDLPQWTKEVYPELMKEAGVDANIISVATPQLTQLSGFLLKKIIRETLAKIEGTLIPLNRKIFLYSGHDYNIVQLLNGLGVFSAHLPPYGAYILIELHQINNEYGIKIFYQDYVDYYPKALEIPGCESVCPFHHFVKLLEGNLPETDNMCDEI